MPSAPGKGKKPLSECMEYDPNVTPMKDGMPRVKSQKTTSASKVRGSKKPHAVS